MLELYDDAARRFHVCDVDFAVYGSMMDFLPFRRKQVLPCSMPFCLGLPPTVANSGADVGPVVKPLETALG
ncbi:hypothetical protein [Rhizobium gallicum]